MTLSPSTLGVERPRWPFATASHTVSLTPSTRCREVELWVSGFEGSRCWQMQVWVSGILGTNFGCLDLDVGCLDLDGTWAGTGEGGEPRMHAEVHAWEGSHHPRPSVLIRFRKGVAVRGTRSFGLAGVARSGTATHSMRKYSPGTSLVRGAAALRRPMVHA